MDKAAVLRQVGAEGQCHGHRQLRHAVGGIPRHIAHANAPAAAVGRIHAVIARGRKADQLHLRRVLQVALIEFDLIGYDHVLIRNAAAYLLGCGVSIDCNRTQLQQRRKVQIRAQCLRVQNHDLHRYSPLFVFISIALFARVFNLQEPSECATIRKNAKENPP